MTVHGEDEEAWSQGGAGGSEGRGGARGSEVELITGRPKEDPNHCMVPLKEVLRG